MALITTAQELDFVWDEARKYLEPALEHCGGTHTINDVYDGVFSSRMQLWFDESAIVTQIFRYPRLNSLELFLMGGDLEKLEAMESKIVDWAREQGIHRIQVGGRRGWTKLGYSELGVCMVKEI